MHKLSTILIALFVAVVAAAQPSELPYRAQGTVTDAISGKPMENVSVSIPGRYFATVTNADGGFTIRSDAPIHTVVFTHVGYHTARKAVGEGPLTVRLERESTLLESALIVSGDPREIVQAAIDRIPDNYSRRSEMLSCFYRETIRKRQRFIFISEATAKLYKSPYNGTISQDRTALSKSRVLLSQRRSDTLSVKMMGGPTLAIYQDAVKNPEVLLEDLDKYRLEMLPPSVIDDRAQFVIRFTPGAITPYPLYDGLVWIDRDRLSFTRMELSLDMSDPARATRMMLIRKPLTLRFRPRELSLTVSYRTENGITRLAYLKSVIAFDCDWKKKLFATQYTAVNELVVTDLLPEAVPIPRAEAFRHEDYLSDKAALFADPDFWEGYNIIEPTESLEHAIGRLKRR